MFHPQYLALLAEVYMSAGQIEAALTPLAEALTWVKKTGEHWWDAELYRLKGELLWKAGDSRLRIDPSPHNMAISLLSSISPVEDIVENEAMTKCFRVGWDDSSILKALRVDLDPVTPLFM
jgi:hypothetical protein